MTPAPTKDQIVGVSVEETNEHHLTIQAHSSFLSHTFHQYRHNISLYPFGSVNSCRLAIMPGLASAQGLIGFLSEPDVDLRVFALKALDEQIDALWIEVAPSIHEM